MRYKATASNDDVQDDDDVSGGCNVCSNANKWKLYLDGKQIGSEEAMQPCEIFLFLG